MRQCGGCLEFFEEDEEPEIWWDEQPFHRECLKEKVDEDVLEENREDYYEVIEDPDIVALEPRGNAAVPKSRATTKTSTEVDS